jgi:hypothetical protein
MSRKRWGTAEVEAALPGLTSIAWSELRSGSGRRAGRLPALLTGLALSPDDKDLRDQIDSELGSSALWSEACPHAIPFLLRIARDRTNPRGAGIAQMVLAEQIYGEPAHDESPALRAQVMAAFEAGRPFFEELLHTGTPADRATAIDFLAGLYGRTDRLRALLADPSLDRSQPLIVDALTDAQHYLDDN